MKGRKDSGKAKEGGGKSKSVMLLNGIEFDFQSIMKEVQHLGNIHTTFRGKSVGKAVATDFLIPTIRGIPGVIVVLGSSLIEGTSDMTWKERKDLQNKKVVSLGGKAPKQQRLPLSVARPMMKNQRVREEKRLREAALLGHCGEGSMVKTTKQPVVEKRKHECGVLKSSQGIFKNGVLDVKHLLNAAPTPRDDNHSAPMGGPTGGKKTTKKKKGGKKSNGNKKGGGGGKKRH